MRRWRVGNVMRAISRYEIRIKRNAFIYKVLVNPFPPMSKFSELMEEWNRPLGQPGDFIHDDLHHFLDLKGVPRRRILRDK